ncbi:30S ribosomal protein S6 [Geotalea uraniireducens]|uniref:Small ribosomal subunit protein bS6 n=1 Tax=Geotalea uraniireducens TaxID=351604 RepID=A0ABN6VNH5_9BACT|nr:30S ribosomal protein S6 [Geotalea uraniireducens]BDV41794.1 30S ribosomal protein S6 [Geotalea uraniireducens]
MVRMYETIMIVQPDLGEEELKGLSTRVQDLIGSMNGELHRLEDWGVRKLAYPVQKSQRGRYYYLRFDGDAALIAELERRLRLNDKVLRYQSVKLEKEQAVPVPKAVATEAAPAAEPESANE